jgi:asparagine synthase (glutamine-hydrolysing)
MLYTTPESLAEKQPFAEETGNYCLSFDGRIDNRDELKKQLQLSGASLKTDTDAELVLRAYQYWGEDCARRLLGDFAFAVWDHQRQQLFCARDILPVKPFYYYLDKNVFVFASELQALFSCAVVPRKPNEAMVGEFLAGAITHQEQTLYQDIFRLPAANYLVVRRDHVQKTRYWDIESTKQIRYRTDRDYADHFFELFKAAVQCRLRSHTPVGAYLSGGLDSSSVVGMVQFLVTREKIADPKLRTFSLIFPGLPADENAYIREVIHMWGLNAETQIPPTPDPSEYVGEVNRYQDFPYYPNGSMSNCLRASAQAKGIRVLLTGLGGDDWLSGSSYHLADMLRQLRFTSFVRQARFDSQTLSFNPSTHRMIRFGIWPTLPIFVRRAIRRMRHRGKPPVWIDAKFARRINLQSRTHQEIMRHPFSSFAQADLYRSAFSGFGSHFAEVEERAASWFGIEQRHPFHDRHIIEFALALPENQRWRGNEPKFILRNAMRDLLPESVRQRQTKAEFSHVFAEVLRQKHCNDSFASSAISTMEWVDGKELRRLYLETIHRYESGDEGYSAHVWTLWLAYGIDLWLRAVFLEGGDRFAARRPA